MSILRMSLLASPLILLIAALRQPMLRRMPAQLMPWLWGLVWVRLMVPGEITLLHRSAASPIRTLDALPALGMAEGVARPIAASGMGADGPLAATAAGLDITTLVWLVGLLISVLMLVIQRLRWQQRLAASTPCRAPAMAEWRTQNPLRRRVTVLSCPAIDVPMTGGVFRPRIYLPAAMDPAALPHVLAHEGMHIRRFHTGVKLLALAAACVHWFNPLVWLMLHLLSCDLELACDALVLRRYDGAARADYARTILRLATERAPRWASAFARHPVEERILRMMKPVKRCRSGVFAAVLIAALSLAMFAGASSEMPEMITYDRSTVVEAMNGREVGEVDERLHDLVVDDALLGELFACRGLEVLLPDAASLPDGFARVEGGTPVQFMQPNPGKMPTMVPGDFVPPEGEPNEIIEEEGVRTERWQVPAKWLTDSFNHAITRYKDADGNTITYQIRVMTLSELERVGNAMGRIGRLDNDLVVIVESTGDWNMIMLAPDAAVTAFTNGEDNPPTCVYIVDSDLLDIDALTDLVRTAKPAA